MGNPLYRRALRGEEDCAMKTYDAHKSTSEVRQGSDRKTNLRVLLISGFVIVVAFALILSVFNLL